MDEAFYAWSANCGAASMQNEIWALILGHGLLVERGRGGGLMERFDLWRRYGWHEAFTYQEATRSYPFVQMNTAEGFREDAGRMQRYNKAGKSPEAFSNEPAETGHPLCRWQDYESREGRTDAARLENAGFVERLGLILDYCAASRSERDLGSQGVVLLKSVPSGGARHPTEVYVFAFDGLEGIAPGSYHYNCANHALTLREAGNHYSVCREATFDLFEKFEFQPRALLMFTSRVERSMWRYRDPRAARAPLIDIGHVLMAMRTAADLVGVSRYTYQKFRELGLCDIARIDPVSEPPFYVATLV